MLRHGDESIRHGSDRLEAKRAGYCPSFLEVVVTRSTLSPRDFLAVSRVIAAFGHGTCVDPRGRGPTSVAPNVLNNH